MSSKLSSGPAGRALWFIETRSAEELTLGAIADAAGVSRFHLTRVFEARTGLSVMVYLRARRLSEAARRLAGGAPDILVVALEAGYGSHEAFTRAFRDAFGMTPEAVREQGHVETLKLQEPIAMDMHLIDTASPHHLTSGKEMRIAGLSRHYTAAETAAIPSQWQEFAFCLPIADAVHSHIAYGVGYNASDDGVDYLSGIEVRMDADLPREFKAVTLKSQTYAVFPHFGHISGIRRVWATIWDRWLPETGLEVLPEPFFEKYGPSFDPVTGEGGFEIWVPVRRV